MKNIFILIFLTLFSHQVVTAQNNSIKIEADVSEEDEEILKGIRQSSIDSVETGRYLTIDHEWSEPYTISSGVSTVSINFNGDMSILSDFVVAKISFLKAQKVSVGKNNEDEYYLRSKVSYWTPGLGIVLGKNDNSDIRFGVIADLVGFRVDNFSLSLGLGWVADGKAEFKNDNFFISVPITFDFIF